MQGKNLLLRYIGCPQEKFHSAYEYLFYNSSFHNKEQSRENISLVKHNTSLNLLSSSVELVLRKNLVWQFGYVQPALTQRYWSSLQTSWFAFQGQVIQHPHRQALFLDSSDESMPSTVLIWLYHISFPRPWKIQKLFLVGRFRHHTHLLCLGE